MIGRRFFSFTELTSTGTIRHPRAMIEVWIAYLCPDRKRSVRAASANTFTIRIKPMQIGPYNVGRGLALAPMTEG